MSSHKEAPGIVNDAAADNTDVYAFVSPDQPDTVTLIANFVPLEDPAGGPNFFEFGNDVLYEIHIDNDGDGKPDITYQFRFSVELENPDTFLYATGPIDTISSANFNRKQFYDVTKVVGGAPGVKIGDHLACPPCNIGPASTPNYKNLASEGIHKLTGGGQVFAGQRAEGFYVDLGAIFDLGILRPFLAAHLVKMPKAPGVQSLLAKNIHSIAIQVPKKSLLGAGADGSTASDMKNVIGVYASASRQTLKVFNADGTKTDSGPYVQISRQAGPLVNEVLIPIPKKDRFNSQDPVDDHQFLSHFARPELADLLPALYPGVFPNLAKYKKPRADIEAIFLTGIPAGVVPGFPGNNTGTVQAELLRLNTAIKPATKPSNLGLLGMDIAGFPNGRRVFDDVTTIDLRALAGAALPYVDKTFKSDAAAGAISPGLTSSNTDVTANNTVHYLSEFPYLGTPHSGYRNPNNNNPASDLGAINQPPGTGTGPVPVGAPQTGFGPDNDNSANGVLVGVGGLALAGVAAAAVTRARPAPAQAVPEQHTRPRPTPHSDRSTDE